MSIVWSISGFVKYLLMYYSKYFPGSMFVNYSIQSFADIICMSYISLVNTYFKNIQEILKYLLTMVILFTMLQLTNERFLYHCSWHTLSVPLLIFIIRLHVVGIQNYQYHANQILFPVDMRGEAFGLVNFVARPFAAFSTILCEYTSSPLSFVLVLSLLSTQAVQHMSEMTDESVPKTKAASSDSDDFVKVEDEKATA